MQEKRSRKKSKEEVNIFYARFLKLTKTLTHREAYEVTERYWKKRTGKRFYKNYASFHVQISKRRKNGDLNYVPNNVPIFREEASCYSIFMRKKILGL